MPYRVTLWIGHRRLLLRLLQLCLYMGVRLFLGLQLLLDLLLCLAFYLSSLQCGKSGIDSCDPVPLRLRLISALFGVKEGSRVHHDFSSNLLGIFDFD